MARKKRTNKIHDSSEEEDDDDSESQSSSESDESDRAGKSKLKGRKKQKPSALRNPNRQQTFSKNAEGEAQQKKKVQIIVDNQQRDDYNMNKRTQYRKPTSIVKGRQTQEEDEKEEYDVMSDLHQEEEDDYALRNPSDRKRGKNRTIIDTHNLVELKSKAKQLDQQNLIIENLEHQLESKQKQVEAMDLEVKQDLQMKDQNIKSLNNQKVILERKVGRHKTYLKKLKEQLNFRKGSIFNLQLERRNSDEEEHIYNNTHQNEEMFSIPIDIQQRMLKKSSAFDKLINYLRYNYPLSTTVHRILNFYTKNEELHFTYIAFNFNLSLIFFLLFIPFLTIQIIEGKSNFQSSKPFSLLMFHEFLSSNLTGFLVVFVLYVLVSAIVQYIRVSYMRKKDVESEAQSSKDLTYFKLVFSSVNFRLSNYGKNLIAFLYYY